MGEFEYTPPKNQLVNSKKLLLDLKIVSKQITGDKLTQKTYKKLGNYDVTTISRRFGSWNKALEKIGMKAGNIVNYSDTELFANLLNIWQHKGKQPVRRDLSIFPSIISQQPYKRRFNSWSDTLLKFIEYVNSNEIKDKHNFEVPPSQQKTTSRNPSLRLRFKVLKRDNFSCKKCGCSPAKDPKVVLHVDHIIPWSKGGETVIENLETLCQDCNLGKSNVL